MNDLPKLYFTMERYLFPLLEEELGELTAKMREFLRIVEVVRPSRFITSALRWCGLGRPMKDREKMLRKRKFQLIRTMIDQIFLYLRFLMRRQMTATSDRTTSLVYVFQLSKSKFFPTPYPLPTVIG